MAVVGLVGLKPTAPSCEGINSERPSGARHSCGEFSKRSPRLCDLRPDLKEEAGQSKLHKLVLDPGAGQNESSPIVHPGSTCSTPNDQDMAISRSSYSGPMRRMVRWFLRLLIRCAFRFLSRLEIVGIENMPAEGPLLVAANHFHFADPVAIIRAFPPQIEFIGGAQMPFAPRIVRFIPKLWGYHAVRRGTGARDALRNAEDILRHGGIVGIFPEGGSWASVLRPARPGTAFLAIRTGARILPVGIDGLLDLFPSLFRGRRAHVTVRIGEAIGPFTADATGREGRARLDEIGDSIMRKIASLIPAERRGRYSADAAIRKAAQEAEAYPWARRTDAGTQQGER